MCDVIEPVGRINQNTFLVLHKDGDTNIEGLFEEEEPLDNQKEFFRLFVSYAGKDWLPGALVMSEGPPRPNATHREYVAFTPLGNLVLTMDGIFRLKDYLVENAYIVSIDTNLSRGSKFDKHVKRMTQKVMVMAAYLETNYRLVKCYESFSTVIRAEESPANYFLSFEEYINHLKTIYNDVSDILPDHRMVICDGKLSIVMDYYVLVSMQGTDDKVMEKEIQRIVTLLREKKIVAPGAIVRFRSTDKVGGLYDLDYAAYEGDLRTAKDLGYSGKGGLMMRDDIERYQDIRKFTSTGITMN